MQQERFITIDEAKAQLCLSTASIYNMFNSGELRKVKLGRKTVLLASDIQSFIQRKTAEATPAAA
ncbi:MAG: helix-turn-helix transcriptional regulator [Sphingorhabdus sp.]